MANSKTSVPVLFPTSKPQNPDLKKKRAYLHAGVHTKSAILALIPALDLTQTATLILTLPLILTQTQNLNPNTNHNNLKNKSK